MADNTASIRYIENKDGDVFFPVTHQRAVIDSDGTNLETALAGKQDMLVSGTSIKTINGSSILGSGNIEVQTSITTDSTPTSGSTNPVESGGVYTALQDKQQAISTVNVSVDNNTGTPSATASISGGTMSIAFSNIKGGQGEPGSTPEFSVGTVSTLPAGSQATVSITGTTDSPVLNIGIPTGATGAQGNTGSSVDYPYELVNNVTTNDATKGLSAAQGVVLDEKISQLGLLSGKIFNIHDSNAYRIWVGTVAELNALEDYEDDVIYLIGATVHPLPEYSITATVTDGTLSNNATTIKEGKPYSATILPNTGKIIDTVSVSMAGTDITSTSYANGVITIASVTGNIVISVVCANDLDAPIVFEDPAVKAIFVSLCDTNNDGEISYREAAAYAPTATVQCSIIKGNTTITSFNEWQYFTNLTSVTIEGCTNLVSVRIPLDPDHVLKSDLGIKNCGLTSLIIPEGYTTINATPTITSCNALASISFPSTLTTLGNTSNGVITNCPALEILDFSGTSLSSVGQRAFRGCTGLKKVIFPDTLTEITTTQTFRECSSIETVEFGTNFTCLTSSASTWYNAGSVAKKLVFRGGTPPTEFCFPSSIAKIYVPASAVETYKQNTLFATYSDKIESIENYTG